MLAEDAESEIKKLKLLKSEIANKIKVNYDFEQRDELEQRLSRVSRQIRILERLKGK